MTTRKKQPQLSAYARTVKKARLNLGWGQRDVAQNAGVAVATVNHFENGAEISLTNALKIMSALGVAMRDISDECEHEYVCKWCAREYPDTKGNE